MGLEREDRRRWVGRRIDGREGEEDERMEEEREEN
jgi:hypothetical protein